MFQPTPRLPVQPAPHPLSLAVRSACSARAAVLPANLRSRAAAGALAALLTGATLAPLDAAQAATITVNSSSGAIAADSVCSLPEAVGNANANAAVHADCAAGSGPDVVTFDTALSGSTINLGDNADIAPLYERRNGLLVSDTLAIDGSSAAAGGSGRVTLTNSASGQGGRSFQTIDSTVTLGIDELNFAGYMGLYGDGGAISAAGPLALSACAFDGFSARSGGAVYAASTLTISACSFTTNAARYYGGAIFVAGDATVTGPQLQISGTTYIGSNRARFAGGGVFSNGNFSIADSSFESNELLGNGIAQRLGATATRDAKGRLLPGYRGGAGLAAFGDPAVALTGTVDNSSFNYNYSYSFNKYNGFSGGGLLFRTPDASGSSLIIQSSVFTGNDAASGGGLYFADGQQSTQPQKGVVYSSRLDVQDSVFELNTAGASGAGLVARSAGPYASGLAVLDNVDFDRNSARLSAGSFLAQMARFEARSVYATANEAKYNAAGYVGVQERGEALIDASSLFANNSTGSIYGTPGVGLSVSSYDVAAPARVLFYGTSRYNRATLLDACSSNAQTGGGIEIATYGPYGSVLVSGATISGNSVNGGGAGIAIRGNGSTSAFQTSTITITGSTLSDNASQCGVGGGISISGGRKSYYNNTTFTEYGPSVLLERSVVAGNTAAIGGGGIAVTPNGGQSAALLGQIKIHSTTIDGNTGASGYYYDTGSYANVPNSGDGGGILVSSATPSRFEQFIVAYSTISNNSGTRGAGLFFNPGRYYAAAKGLPTRLIYNSTFSGNIAADESAVYVRNGSFAIDFTTIAANSAGTGSPGLFVVPNYAFSTFDNSIAADNIGGSGYDVAGNVSANYSLIENPGSGVVGANNIFAVDPQLGPLADNGGPTYTHLPADSSPVVDAGSFTVSSTFSYDQRLAPFARQVGSAPDMGAVEVGAGLANIVSISLTPSSFNESASSTLTVTADQSVRSDTFVTIDFAGIAIQGVDFTTQDADPGTTGTQVLIAAGTNQGSITLNALTDALDEPDEDFSATVGTVSGPAATPTPALSTTGTIIDINEPIVTSIVISPMTFPEGGSSTLTVTTSAPLAGDAFVTIDFSGVAQFGVDFTAEDDDSATNGTQVLIAAGTSTGSIGLTALNDVVDETDESLIATAGALSGPVDPAPGPVAGSATITDINAPPVLSVSDVTVNEGDGTAVFTLSLQGSSSMPVSVVFATADGTARAGVDYNPTSGTRDFPAGVTTRTVSVPIIQDLIVEGTEQFFLRLFSPVNATIGDNEGIGTILDDDVVIPTATLSLQDSPLGEGQSTEIIVTLSGPAPGPGPTVITLGFGGTTTFGVDYTVGDDDTSTPGIQIVIPAGETVGSVTLSIIEDGEVEGPESLTIEIIGAIGATEAGGSQIALGSVLGDPPPAPPTAELVPTLNEWMLMLLGLLLPATVIHRFRKRGQKAR